MSRYYEDLPEWASDTVYTHVETHVSFLDRLRILLLGKFSMRVVVNTENVIGRTASHSQFFAPRFHLPKRQSYGMLHEPDEACSEEG